MVIRIAIVLLLAVCSLALQPGAQTARRQLSFVTLQEAYPIKLPGGRLPEAGIEDAVDCNSPVHWDRQGNLHVFTSVRHPFRSAGANLYGLTPTSTRTIINHKQGVEGGKWLEATHYNNGVLYGWYHNEPADVCPNDPHLSAPRIGAMVSYDEGMTWQDLGIILEAPRDSLDCETKNYYFAGGVGDFSVLLDNERKYFYFFIGAYHRQIEEQGVAIARMRYEDRRHPVGRVWKWRDGQWSEPGLGGRSTPIFGVARDWRGEDPDAYWGPSIHYNTYLDTFVIVMNRAVNKYWLQEGVYISYNPALGDPQGWTEPERLPLDPQAMAYPQIIGVNKGETDKLVGRSGRLFLLGQSKWAITFHRNEDNEDCGDCLGPAPARTDRQTGNQPSLNRQMIRAARPSLLTDLDKPTQRTAQPQRIRPSRNQ
ncbi:MAG: hypothetical protein ACREAM_28305 [Blastocatellia bacterium]